MSESVALVSSASITSAEFKAFVLEVGAAPLHDDRYLFEQGDSAIWMTLSPDTLIATLGDDSEGLIESRLKNSARSCCVVDIGHGAESEQMALRFAVQFMKRWPSVFYDYHDDVYEVAEIRNKLARHESLWPVSSLE